MYTIWLFGCTVAVAIVIVILCLLAAADFYIVVSQDVVTVAVALEMHACVGRDQHLCCLLFPPRHQHVCAFITLSVTSELTYA